MTLFLLALVSGCNGQNSDSSGTSSAPSGSSSGGGATGLTISGQPATAGTVGQKYSLQPTAKGGSGALSFSATNLPSWLSISSSTGLVSGTPSTGNVGTYTNIVISVSDGKSSAHMPAFSIAVSQAGTSGGGGSATLTWSMPTQNADGTPLTDLTGFVIRYGQSPSSLTQQINIDNPSVNTYTIDNLSAGTWYFAVITMAASGNYSSPTNVASKTI